MHLLFRSYSVNLHLQNDLHSDTLGYQEEQPKIEVVEFEEGEKAHANVKNVQDAKKESHQNLAVDTSLKIYAVVLGKEHMSEIDRVTNNALRIADVINRGKDGEELKYVYSIDEKIFPQAENNCLPISIMLASVIERGVILGEKQFSRGKPCTLSTLKT